MGRPGTCAPPAEPCPSRCLCFSLTRFSAAPALTAGLRGSWEPGNAARWPLGVSEAAAARSSRCLRENSPCSRASRQARPQPELQGGLWPACSASSPPPQFHADPHLRPKNPFRTRILFRIKTLFCFVSQSVSSKECRTLRTNLVFFPFTDFLQSRRMLQT